MPTLERDRRADLLEEASIELIRGDLDFRNDRAETAKNLHARSEADSVAEHYRSGNLAFHLHVWGRIGKLDLCEYCFMCQAILGEERYPMIKNRIVVQPRETPTPRSGRCDRQQLVFVSVIKHTQSVQRRLCGVRSTVRLQELDQCSCASRLDSGDHLPAFHHSAPSLLRDEDGELCLGIASLASSQLPRKVVEGSAQVMHAVADDDGPIVRRNSRWIVGPHNEQIFRFAIDGDTVRVISKKRGDFVFNRVEMHLRPTNLGATSLQCHVAELLYGQKAKDKRR